MLHKLHKVHVILNTLMCILILIINADDLFGIVFFIPLQYYVFQFWSIPKNIVKRQLKYLKAKFFFHSFAILCVPILVNTKEIVKRQLKYLKAKQCIDQLTLFRKAPSTASTPT